MEEPDPLDPDFSYLFDWFWSMRAGLSAGLNGAEPLSMTEMAHWMTLTGDILRREEIRILRSMDDAYLAAVARERAEAAERSPK